MAGNIQDLENEIQESYWKLIMQLSNEALVNQLTRQVVISFRGGQIVDVRNNQIIAGASILDFFLSG